MCIRDRSDPDVINQLITRLKSLQQTLLAQDGRPLIWQIENVPDQFAPWLSVCPKVGWMVRCVHHAVLMFVGVAVGDLDGLCISQPR